MKGHKARSATGGIGDWGTSEAAQSKMESHGRNERGTSQMGAAIRNLGGWGGQRGTRSVILGPDQRSSGTEREDGCNQKWRCIETDAQLVMEVYREKYGALKRNFGGSTAREGGLSFFLLEFLDATIPGTLLSWGQMIMLLWQLRGAPSTGCANSHLRLGQVPSLAPP